MNNPVSAFEVNFIVFVISWEKVEAEKGVKVSLSKRFVLKG